MVDLDFFLLLSSMGSMAFTWDQFVRKHDINQHDEFEIYISEITAASSRDP